MLEHIRQRFLDDAVGGNGQLVAQAREVALGVELEMAFRVAGVVVADHFFDRAVQAEHVQHFRPQTAHQAPSRLRTGRA
ncbi:hypothetical protein LP419_17180 [Massilia sp. H-1]|nr:hypothetical protein LP419_17180 [Massilia sp. H-1]